jgi:prevent-host-death family protein
MAMEMNMVDVRGNLAEVVNRVAYGGERVVLKRRAKGVAAVVSMEDLKLLEELEDRADVRAALKARKEKGAVPLEKVMARLGMK